MAESAERSELEADRFGTLLRPLLGRDAELARIRAVIAQAETGSARLVVIEGEAGIGKSRILDEVAKDATGAVLTATAEPLEADRPFAIFAEALGPEWPTSTLASGELGRPVDALVDEIERRAAASPLLLAFDDLQWADASSLLAIDQVLRRLADRPVAVVATARPTPRTDQLTRLVEASRGERGLRIQLPGLAGDAVDQIAAMVLRAQPGPLLRDLLRGASGNPFFVTELLGALAQDGTVEVRDGTAELAGPQGAPSLRLAIFRRAGVLPPDALEVLGMATVLGSRFDLDDLSVVLDRRASDLLATLTEALAAGVVAEDGARLAFRHELVRDALYHDMPASVRRALHLQAGRTLAAAGRPASSVARHFAAGARPGDPEAVSWLRRAANEAMAQAPDVAVELLGTAVDLAREAVRATRDELIVDLATARFWAGQTAAARRTLEELVDRPHDRSVDGPARLGLIQLLIVEGRPREALAHCDAIETAAGVGAVQQARARTDAAMARLMGGDLDGAEGDATRALEEGARLGDDAALCGALAALAWVANLRGSTDRAVELGRRAIEVAETSEGHEARRRYPQSYLGLILMSEDDLDEARHLFDAGRRVAEELGDVWPLPIHHFGSVLDTFYRGQIEDAAAELDVAVAVAEETETRMFVLWSHAVAALLALHRDDLAEAAAQLREGEAVAESAGPGMGYDWLLWARACWHEASGDLGAATELLALAWEAGETLGIVGPRRIFAPDLVRCALAVGDRELAETVTAGVQHAALGSPTATARAVALRCSGLLTSEPGPLLEAAALLRAGPRRLELAAAAEEAAELLCASNRTDRALELLGEARQIYEAGGSTRGRRRTEAALRHLGVSVGSRGRRRRPAMGWDALTPTEHAVTRLAAEGLTNPEIGGRLFISRRTVETHLSHVFAKLGVTSRVALAAEVARRGAGPRP